MAKYRGIALCGKQRSGKDTTREHLTKMDPNFVKVSFADPLKQLAGQLTGLDFFDEETKKQNRWFIQMLGTDLMRRFDEDYWVKKLEQYLPGVYEMNMVPVVTDARFPNEADMLKRNGFLVVRLDVQPETIIARGGKVENHPSETALDDYDGYDLILPSEAFMPDEIAAIVLLEFRGGDC